MPAPVVGNLVLAPDERLHQACASVTHFGPELRALADDMAGLMYESDGIGLAAPQIGVLQRVVVLDCTGEGPQVFVNPVVLWSQGNIEVEEGCLSFPGHFIKVRRAALAGVAYQNLGGESRMVTLDGLWAICAQHEIDHVDGITFDMRAAGQAA